MYLKNIFTVLIGKKIKKRLKRCQNWENKNGKNEIKDYSTSTTIFNLEDILLGKNKSFPKARLAWMKSFHATASSWT